MSDKTKKKKIDVRLTDEMYREIAVVAWGLDTRKSSLLRDMMMYFVEHTMLTIDGQLMTWEQAVHYFEQQMLAENLTVEDISKRSASGDTAELPPELETVLQYSVNAVNALKTYLKVQGND